MSMVIVRLKDGREITVLKAHASMDAFKMKDDVERWISEGVVISFATHSGLQEVPGEDIASVEVRARDGGSEAHPGTAVVRRERPDDR